jgi:hypothetical protein
MLSDSKSVLFVATALLLIPPWFIGLALPSANPMNQGQSFFGSSLQTVLI